MSRMFSISGNTISRTVIRITVKSSEKLGDRDPCNTICKTIVDYLPIRVAPETY
jgi:hypothetical protein